MHCFLRHSQHCKIGLNSNCERFFFHYFFFGGRGSGAVWFWLLKFSFLLDDFKPRVKSWEREARFSPPGFHAAIFFRGFLSRHARRTKRKRDYLQSSITWDYRKLSWSQGFSLIFLRMYAREQVKRRVMLKEFKNDGLKLLDIQSSNRPFSLVHFVFPIQIM